MVRELADPLVRRRFEEPGIQTSPPGQQSPQNPAGFPESRERALAADHPGLPQGGMKGRGWRTLRAKLRGATWTNCNGAVIGTLLRTGMRRCATYISSKEIAMFKAAVVVFALTVSGFMLWVAHQDANFAQLPHATFIKRAA
jgi:hypothetical protein